MTNGISEITIEGFKSIRRLDSFPLGPLNVLIGANGAGKSNFVDFFRLLHAVTDGVLQRFVNVNGGINALFHLGPRVTPAMRAAVRFRSDDGYAFELEPTVTGDVIYGSEMARLSGTETFVGEVGYRESQLLRHAGVDPATPTAPNVYRRVFSAVSNSAVYHFHDTGPFAAMRGDQSVRDYEGLRPDAGNIAAYLLRLRATHAEVYETVRDLVRFVLPVFEDFRLRADDPNGVGDERVRLEWKQSGSNYTFQPFQWSDGTIRFICLATALLQPNPPATMVFDEPELGLHPHALQILGDLIYKASAATQVVVSTQSASLLSGFEPADVVVVTSRNAASEFRRLGADELSAFLEDYSLGALWERNYIDGASNG